VKHAFFSGVRDHSRDALVVGCVVLVALPDTTSDSRIVAKEYDVPQAELDKE